jgi:hypothetical protein
LNHLERRILKYQITKQHKCGYCKTGDLAILEYSHAKIKNEVDFLYMCVNKGCDHFEMRDQKHGPYSIYKLPDEERNSLRES